MRLNPGTQLGPYTIISLLGAGGMGEVYRAKDPRIGREVAIKVLPESFANDKEGLARFEQEAKAAGMLNHPNLLTIFDVGDAGGSYYMVSELLTGESLREVMARQPIPRRKVINYALQLAQGLAAAHDKGLVHRDLKPDNVFVTIDERVKILDFGLAKLRPGFEPDDAAGQLKTEPGIVLGTVGYMSPEQVKGEQLDQRSDIFSFGAILYEMLSGTRAFKRDTAVETLTAILREDPIDAPEVSGRIPAPLERVVRRCLEKRKEARFQSARDLAFHLETVPPTTVTGVQTPAVPSTAPPAPVSNVGPTGTGAVSPPIASFDADQPTATLGQIKAPGPTEQQPVPPTSRSTASRSTATVRQRPFPTHSQTSVPPRARTTNPGVMVLTAIVLASAGAVGGYMFHHLTNEEPVPSFQRLTFRQGQIYSARFAPDGDTILYSASWDGKEPEIFMMRRQSPESKSFGFSNANMADISATGEVAILLDVNRLTGLGRLARVPLMGGQPRDVMEDVLHAAWLPNGDLAVINQIADKYRLEVPIGNVLIDSLSRIDHLKISPDGSRVAYVQPTRGQFDIVMFDQGQAEVLTSGWSNGITGMEWSPDGETLWFTAAETGTAPPSLYSVKPGEGPKLASRLTGSLTLEDISADGRFLLEHTTWRASLMVKTLYDETERDISWLDWSTLRHLSADGRQILFSETREGGGNDAAVYLRSIDGNAPVKLGNGLGDAISPDGEWVLAHANSTTLFRLPTGSGEPAQIATIDAFDQGVRWFPDGKNILIAGSYQGSGYRICIQNLESGLITPLTGEGIWGAGQHAWAISPDGSEVAAMNEIRRLTIYSVPDGRARPLVGAEAGEIPITWSADGASIFVYDPSQLPARVFQINLETEERLLWKQFTPRDSAGVDRVGPIFITPDAGTYAYNTFRTLSTLYVAEGLE